MTSINKNCVVLHCESGCSSDVEFFDFPPSNDPRYAIWIERTLQDSQWTPSSTSTICSRHFPSADILTTKAADDSGKNEKRLKYDALPCVFECLPESERPQAVHVPRPDSPEIIYQEPKHRASHAVPAASDGSTACMPTVDVASLPISSVDEDPNVCCVPGCHSRRQQGVMLRGVPTIRFHAFPTDKHLRWEWTKRVRCSVSWQPGPSAVVCSAHFAATEYELPLISGMLCLKPTAIPRQLACVEVFMMRRTERPGVFDRMCAICGCWRMRNQRHYKAAAKLAFVPFPTDPVERDKWKALGRGISGGADLLVCENHFLLNEIVSRFRKNGEENFSVRPGVVPRVQPTLWLDPQPCLAENEVPRATVVDKICSPENHGDMPVVQIPETVSNAQPGPNSVVLCQNGIATPNVQGRSIPGKLSNARNVESAGIATEFCCVPGCSVTSSNAGEKGAPMLRFVSRANWRYTTWINRIRCATTWAEKYTLAICSKHFSPEDFDPLTRMLSPNALPSQLSCISVFHFSGLREGETDATGMQTCVVCFAKRKRGSTKPSEILKLFPLPADPVVQAAWCKFVSAQTGGQDFDPGTLICENHFLPADFTVVGGVLKPSAVPSCTFRLQPEFMPRAYTRNPVLTVKSDTHPIGSTDNSAKSRYRCCVSGCKHDGISKREKVVTCFKFVAADDPRYETWLERVRPHLGWIPNKATVLCSDHFLPSQITVHVSGGATKRILSKTALPSLLNGECRWQPNELPEATELKRFEYDCCIPGCENKRGTLGSKDVKFFRFVAANDPRYATWLQRVRPSDSWTPDGKTRICSAHFLSSQTGRHRSGRSVWTVLNCKALPSLLNGKTMWEPADFGSITEEEAEPNDTRRFLYNCCVPGCRNIRNRIGSKNVSFFKFIAPDRPRYHTWLRRVQYNSVWIPTTSTTVCSEHFLETDFVRRKRDGATRLFLTSTAVPSQLSCMTALSGFTESDMISGKAGCVVCGLIPLSTNRELKLSERLQFFHAPVGELRAKWIDFVRTHATQIDSERLAESTSWFVCENHFAPESFEPQTEKVDEARCLLTDAVPSLPFTLELDYIDPVLRLTERRSEPIQSDGTVAKKAKRKKDTEDPSVFNSKPVMKRNTVPSGRNFAWPNSESCLFGASDVDMDGTMDDHTETNYDDAFDTQLRNVSSVDENPTLPSSVVKWQVSPDNGLPDDDTDDSFVDAMHLMTGLPPALPSSMDGEPTESTQPLLATSGALMYCAKCEVFLEAPCWLHSNIIPDEPVISLAVGSLPSILYMDVCDDSSTGKTVFAKDTVPRYTVFGPLVAPLMADNGAGAQYFAVSDDVMGSRRKHYHLESDYACNWIKYVRFADSMEASNLLVFARGLEIVFVTSRTIYPHEELRVWYSAPYTEMITDVKPFIPDLHPDREVTALQAEALVFVDDGASLCGVESDEREITRVSFQNFPVAILPASTVPPLPENTPDELDTTKYQTLNRKNHPELHVEPDYSNRSQRNHDQHMRFYHPASKLDSCTDRRRSSRKRPKPLQHIPRVTKRSKTAGSTCCYCGVCFPTEALCQLHVFRHGRKEYAESLQFPQECPECCEVLQELPELVDHVEKHGERVENGTMPDESLTESETETCVDDPVPRENGFENASAPNEKYPRKCHQCPECGEEFRIPVGRQANLKVDNCN